MMRVRGQPALILKLLVYFAVLTSACQSTLKEKDSSSPNRIVLIDAAGLEVNLERPAQRIISLVPSATQTLQALGVSHKLIGRTDFDVEDWASDIPSVGGGLEPNFEKIIALKPDLVVRFAGEQDPNTRSRLDDFGIAHLSISPDRLTDLYKSILLLGKATGAEVVAASIILSIKEDLVDLQQWTSEKPRLQVAYILGGSPPWVAGPGTYIDEILGIAGAQNVFSDLGFLYGSVSPEQMRSRIIDVVLISDNAQFDHKLTPEARVEKIGKALEFPGPNLAQTARQIAHILHQYQF